MMHTQTIFVLLLIAVASIQSFRSTFHGRLAFSSGINQIVRRADVSISQNAIKPDLFSDDLFEDDENSDDVKKETKKEDDGSSKKSYLDQKWQLNEEDAKEFKGFPKKDAGLSVAEKTSKGKEPAQKVPSFALMYKFRKEYLEQDPEASLADHNGYCLKFKRLLNSEVIDLGKAKGVVVLWAGFAEDDQVETKAEIMSFLEEDPLIVKDVVENWDLIELTPGAKQEDLPKKKV